ncbi:MAG: hypothetical protein D6705_04440, partial [Deltaproteobacteria bacterium]
MKAGRSKGRAAALERAMRRHLRHGWIRGVFAAPGDTRDDALEIHPGSGPGRPNPSCIDVAVDAAVRAADRGLTRQTWVLDACTRLRVDARTG